MSDLTPSDIIVLVSIVSSGTVAVLVSFFAIRAQAKTERSRSANEYAKRKIEELKELHREIMDALGSEQNLEKVQILDRTGALRIICQTLEFSDHIARLYSANRYHFDQPKRAQLVKSLEECKKSRDRLAELYIDATMIEDEDYQMDETVKAWTKFGPAQFAFFSEFADALSDEIAILDNHLSRDLTKLSE